MSNVSGISRHSGISGLSNINVNNNIDSINGSLRNNKHPDLAPITTNSANAPHLKQAITNKNN
jgi:hypothetical protein